MDTTVLENLGLSKNEVLVFVKLLELGESKSGIIISKTGLQSSAVYNAISTMIDKGLISFIKKNSIKYYRAAEPETILNYIDTTKREYLKLMPELKIKQKQEDTDGVEYYKSYRGIKTLIFELLKDATKKDVYRYIAPESKYYNVSTEKVYSAEKQIRKEIGLKTLAIYPEDSRNQTTKSKTSIKKYISFPLPPNISMLNNKVAIISWEGEPTGILIKSKDIYQTYVNFFEHLWKIAKG